MNNVPTFKYLSPKISVLICFLFAILFACQNKPCTPIGMVYVTKSDKIDAFFIDESPVTVSQFELFVKKTNYVTEAEKFGNAAVFDFKIGEWRLIAGAYWLYPRGKTEAKAISNHPVTQVSWNDAKAYCKWIGKRLLSSQEYILAASNASTLKQTYAWGNEALENGKWKTNTWQGSFPEINTGEDGFLYTSPVGCFGKTKLGLTDMGGNVWQWVEDWNNEMPKEKSMCGGSFLCDPKVCHGFKIGAIKSSTPETSLMHVGFRCAKDTQ